MRLHSGNISHPSTRFRFLCSRQLDKDFRNQSTFKITSLICSKHAHHRVLQAYNRYVTSETLPLIRITQEARETRKIAFAEFYGTLMAEFDNDRETWLKAVR
jgi:hypothetical protein